METRRRKWTMPKPAVEFEISDNEFRLVYRPRDDTRSALLHLRALQAPDAAQAGASHRQIAQTLFGLEVVMLRWHEDGELRAQIRHLLRRARAYMGGGYLALAGVRRTGACPPGDETLR
jgi:hypothetical protein